LTIGLLYHATGNWHASLAVLTVALVAQAVSGLSAGRPRLLEDSLTLGHQAIGTPAGGRLWSEGRRPSARRALRRKACDGPPESDHTASSEPAPEMEY